MSDDQRRPTATDTEAWLRTELLYWFTGANGLGWSPSTPGLPKRIDSLVELFARAQRRESAPTNLDATVVESIRAEERERCAKALEAERERVADEQGGMLGEMAVYDICALHIRQLAGGQN
jgi:hypothetical protein